MAAFWTDFKSTVRTGAWLTPERVRNYCLIVLTVSVAGICVWIALSDGLIDRNGKPLGTDFASFYAAGTMVLDGRAADVYDMAAHYAREQHLFGSNIPYYAWLYPPVFLLVATPLAMVPYGLAVFVWQIATLLLYLGAIRLIVRSFGNTQIEQSKIWILAAIAFPAVFVNLGHGQNGFLSAALLGGALVVLPTRPLLAGLLFGLLAYKPQFALVIPIALLAGGHWRAIVAVCVSVTLLVAATIILFGTETWFSFLASTEISRKLLLEQGDVGFEKLQSVFAAVRMWGGGVTIAYLAQAIVSLTVICSTAWIWRSKIDHAQKATILIIGTLLASPHVLDYDLVILGIAIAFYAMSGLTRGFRDYEITLLAMAWVVPLFARAFAGHTGVPIGLMILAALYILALRRAASDAESLK